MTVLIVLLTAVHVLVALFVIVLVLMQKSSEQGVGAAFGGGMTETVFGAGTTTALVRMTIWCACLLLATTLILAVLHSHRSKNSGSLMRQNLTTMPMQQAPQDATPTFPGATPSSTPAPANTPTTTPAAPSQSSAEKPAPAAPAPQPAAAPKTP